MKPRQYLLRFWNALAGEYDQFTPANRAFNAVSVITLFILLILLPFNIFIGLYPVAAVMVAVLLLQAGMYYLSRWHKKYVVGIITYAFCSYITLGLNYFFNAGSTGPTLCLFFLTYQLLIAFSPKKYHLGWTALHLLLPLGLMAMEYGRPNLVPDTYYSRGARLLDLSSSYLVILVCMYCITIYLRNNYSRERGLALEREKKIQAQNEALEKADREKNKMFSIISHDLRAPLNSIITALELLDEYELSEDERKKINVELLSVSRNTADMLMNLLSWSSARIKDVRVHRTEVHLQAVVVDVLRVQQSIAAAKQIRIIVDVPYTALALADRDMVELIVRNLVQNAIKFTHASGIVHICSYSSEGGVVLAVKDNGRGMTEEQQIKLFQLQTTPSYGTQNEKGTGLGLVLCNEFAEMMAGRLWVESLEGTGSAFYLYLPAALMPEKAATKPMPRQQLTNMVLENNL
ncbi:sensor histidine kinase [Foetidibacter luteolus]|uniref:sensor histidine kinase n=1 Tax=Foetidibacter luteolus TaxID=2608880 RepID=UPI00129C09FA|nr:HAMP domain-containing sensor histidine kinase [Foetidibacter luteolus]